MLYMEIHVHILYVNISLVSSQNEKQFRQKLQRKSKGILCSVNFTEFRAVHETVRRNLVQPDGTQMSINNGACALHAGQLRLQTHTQNIQYALLTTAVRNMLRLVNSAKGNHSFIFVATLNTFTLLTATSTPTIIKRKRIVAFPWQQRLRERAAM